jgi:hypothetical protein
MNSIEILIESVRSSRKRTGIVYSSGSFQPIVLKLQKEFDEIKLLDCTSLYKGTLTYSAGELLDEIEFANRNSPGIVTNLEAFIVSNSYGFEQQLAKLLSIREPLKPLFFLFYSKKVYMHFRTEYEIKLLNQNNILEL